MATTYFDYPFHIDGRGRTAEVEEDDHINDLIRQVLFTSPGERVNRPDFGCGLKELIFMPNSDAVASATQALVQSALRRWLDALIEVRGIQVVSDESRLYVAVAYVKRSTGEEVREVFLS